MIYTFFVYLLVCAFVIGRIWDVRDSFWENTLGAILVLFFGVPLLIWEFIKLAGEWIERTFQFNFFISFWFRSGTKGYHNLPEWQLEHITQSLELHPSNSIQDRIWRYAVKLVNKRNKRNKK
jgi:hypothetical protein